MRCAAGGDTDAVRGPGGPLLLDGRRQRRPRGGHEVTGRKAKGDGGDASVSPRVSARSGSLLGNRTARDALSRAVGRSRSGSKIQEVCMARPCTAT